MPVCKSVKKNLKSARENVKSAVESLEKIFDKRCVGYRKLTDVELNGMNFLYDKLISFETIMGEFKEE